MSKCKIYDEKVEVKIIRNKEEMAVPFCELREGDIVNAETTFVVGTDAHQCEDPHYEGWLVYDDDGNSYFPEDFGAELLRDNDGPEGEAHKTMSFDVHLYTHYEYERKPLAFVVLPTELTAEQKCKILLLVDEFYANTDQETTDWALEYQLWARMMICDGKLASLPVNTFAHHLILHKENVEKICDVLGTDSDNATMFRTCAENVSLHELVCNVYANDPDCYEGFGVLMKNGVFYLNEEAE